MAKTSEAVKEKKEVDQIDYGAVKERLEAAFAILSEEANINPALMRLVSGMFQNFINNANGEELVTILLQIRDDLLPFILEGSIHDS